jgi:NADH-quinone oxidoreductase subunit H
VLWFPIKVVACLLLMILVRATLPRVRYDKLMSIGWKTLIPVMLANVMLTAILIVAGVPGYK